MKPIQPILLILIVIIAIVYFSRLRRKTWDRLIVIFFILTGAILIAAPDLSTTIAQLVGVGRGADLLLYLGIVGLSFVCLLLYAKLRQMETTLTELVRLVALQNAISPGAEQTPAEEADPSQEHE